MTPNKRKPRATNTGPSNGLNASNSTDSEAVKPSWRNFYEPHPAALVFHQHTTEDDRQKMRDDLNETQHLQARIVTAHVADESGGKVFVVDGITRLDEMEKLGWQTVDQHGNWIGQLEGMVDHRRNYTHEQVAKLVISLNAKRRHTEKSILADAIVEALKLERKTDKGSFSQSKRETSPQGGRPRDEFKTEAVKRGAAAGISKSTIEKSLAKQPDRPKINRPKPVRKGTTVEGTTIKGTTIKGSDLCNIFDEKFKNEVWRRFTQMMQSIAPNRHKDAKAYLLQQLQAAS